jgi:hypothetical protein
MSTRSNLAESTNVLPTYGAIKARAIELLRDGAVNDHLVAGLKLESRWCLRNTISVAIIIARDEFAKSLPLERRIWRRRMILNNQEFARMRAEISRELRAGLHDEDEDEPKFSAFMRDATWPDFIATNDQLYKLMRERGESGDDTDERWRDFLGWRWEQLRLARQFDAEIAS